MLLYRVLISLFATLTLFGAMRRGGLRLVRARLGLTPGQKGAHLWWHGASNGELTSALPVLEAMIDQNPTLRVLVTCNSATGQALVEGWGLPQVTALPAPLDLAWVTHRMMNRWSVVGHVSLESEIWPNRVLHCPGPVMILGARMTPSTARQWQRFPALAGRVMRRLDFVSAQDARSLEQLRSLGLPDKAIGPVADLKALYAPRDVPTPDDTLTAAFPRDRTWLAASTHEGEETTVLKAHATALRTDPDLRLILAPRHATRGAAVATLVREAGLTCARRSSGDQPGGAQVYLADTMGEMPLWYALAGRVFVGGSLTDRGGHTPYEPAAFGCALIHGPDVANFRPAYDRLDGANAAARIDDATGLAQALIDLSTPSAQRDAGQRAQAALTSPCDAPALAATLTTHLRDSMKS